MTFREKLADLISGGAFSEARDNALYWRESYDRMYRVASEEVARLRAQIEGKRQ